jgi:2-polyprenyl-6-methoxyphenol hydroxylase-like FAD-dependent oxidoreductase
MFADARSVPRDIRLETDVCIVGAGPAGITLAREFIGSSFRVTVLEMAGWSTTRRRRSSTRAARLGCPIRT